MKNDFITLSIFFFFSLTFFGLNAQNQIDWPDPKFRGLPVDWKLFLFDSTASATHSFPYLADSLYIHHEVLIQHSDGDLLFLNQSHGLRDGYLLSKVDPETGKKRWTQTMTGMTYGERLGGYDLHETTDGQIEVFGIHYLADRSLPSYYGPSFRTIHEEETGNFIERFGPISTPTGGIFSPTRTITVPIKNDSKYLVFQGRNNGFRVTELGPDFNFNTDGSMFINQYTASRNGTPITGFTPILNYVEELNSGDFLVNLSVSETWTSDINTDVANLLLFISKEGIITKTIDLTEELGFCQKSDIVTNEQGILAYTTSSLEEFADTRKYLSHAVFVDYSGNIIWKRNLTQDFPNISTCHFISIPESDQFMGVLTYANEKFMDFFTISPKGDFDGIGDLSSEITYHSFSPHSLFFTNNKDLIINLAVKMDTIIDGHDLNGLQSKHYAIKISGENLGLTSSTSDISKNSSPVIFPNPAENIVNITLSDRKKLTGQLRFVNALGQIELTQKLERQESTFSVDISALPSGIYRVQVWEQGQLIETQSISIVKK